MEPNAVHKLKIWIKVLQFQISIFKNQSGKVRWDKVTSKNHFKLKINMKRVLLLNKLGIRKIRNLHTNDEVHMKKFKNLFIRDFQVCLSCHLKMIYKLIRYGRKMDKLVLLLMN